MTVSEIVAELQANGSDYRVRHAMNAFVISVGGYVKPLTDAALRGAARIGTVAVNMGETACKVPAAADYIKNMQMRGVIGKKRKTVKC